MIRRKQRMDVPKAPPDLQEEVELYARESGRTARLLFIPGGGWMARFELRPNDPRLKIYQEGRSESPPFEDVYFHVPRQRYDAKVHPAVPGHGPRPDEKFRRPFIPLDIIQMGRSGLRAYLEAGNTWSGRGVYASQEEAFRKETESNETRLEAHKSTLAERAGERARYARRKITGDPQVNVSVDLKTKES